MTENINVSVARANGKVLRVVGKGRKERIIPFGGRATEALVDYLKVRGKRVKVGQPAKTKKSKPSGEALFLNFRGGRLTGRSIGNIVIAMSAGLLKTEGSSHTCATPSQLTCSVRAPICAPFRNSWDTKAFHNPEVYPCVRGTTGSHLSILPSPCRKKGGRSEARVRR